MREPKLIERRDVALDEITVPKRLRPASKSAVAAVRDSIEEMHVALTPIALRAVDGRLELIAGLHRLEAYRELGRAEIRAEIWDCSANWAKLAEIDENLAGADLSTLEQAQFLAARKRLYEQLHPETKRGTAGALARWSEQTRHVSFASAISEKRGISVRHVQGLTKFGQSIDPDAAAILGEQPVGPTFRELKRLCGLPGDEQARAARMLRDGEAATLKAAINAVVPPERTDGHSATSDEEAFARKITGLFGRADVRARRRAIRGLISAHRDLIEAELAAGEG